MCEVVELSDDEDFPKFYSSQASSTVGECSQSSQTTLTSTNGGLDSAQDDELPPADPKKVVQIMFLQFCKQSYRQREKPRGKRRKKEKP